MVPVPELTVTEAVVLAGGLGTRMGSAAGDVPKVLAPVGGAPFLRFLLDSLDRCGMIRTAVIAVGHRGGEVEAWVRASAPRWRFEPRFTHEERLLGTGGGLRLALEVLSGEATLVLNGDSFCAYDPEALEGVLDDGASLALTACRVPDASRFGTLELGSSGEVLGFLEKGRSGPGWINAGAYALRRADFLADTPAGQAFSLERDLLPRWVAHGRVAATPLEGDGFLDIGEPAAYAAAPEFLRRRGLLDA